MFDIHFIQSERTKITQILITYKFYNEALLKKIIRENTITCLQEDLTKEPNLKIEINKKINAVKGAKDQDLCFDAIFHCYKTLSEIDGIRILQKAPTDLIIQHQLIISLLGNLDYFLTFEKLIQTVKEKQFVPDEQSLQFLSQLEEVIIQTKIQHEIKMPIEEILEEYELLLQNKKHKDERLLNKLNWISSAKTILFNEDLNHFITFFNEKRATIEERRNSNRFLNSIDKLLESFLNKFKIKKRFKIGVTGFTIALKIHGCFPQKNILQTSKSQLSKKTPRVIGQ